MNKKSPLENKIKNTELENDTREPAEREIEKIPKDKPEIGEESTWSKDQQEKSYYYDDDHGYQTYIPEDENEE